MKNKKHKGFTLIEVVVVIAIVAILGIVALVNLSGSRNNTDLTTTRDQIVSLLREAQANSISGKGGVAWGVNFANYTGSASYDVRLSPSIASVVPVPVAVAHAVMVAISPGPPFFVLFASSTWSPSVEVGGRHSLPASISYDSSIIAQGTANCVVFSEISGTPLSGTGCGLNSIRIFSVSNPSLSSTISVATSGAVSYSE